MTDPKHLIALAASLASAMLVVTPAALAQAADWQGQDSEFGSIRAPYNLEMNGERVPIEARIVLRENYVSKDSRFFMFAFTVENTPLNVEFDNLVRMDTGEEMPCFKREGTSTTAIKCSVDLREMPEPGVEIRMLGSVGSRGKGMSQVGAMVIPFTYAWTRVQMSNGLNAELYAGTQVNVLDCPGKCRLTGSGAAIPDIGLVGVAAAGALAVGVVAMRRRR